MISFKVESTNFPIKVFSLLPIPLGIKGRVNNKFKIIKLIGPLGNLFFLIEILSMHTNGIFFILKKINFILLYL